MKRLTKHSEYMGKKHISVDKDEGRIICSNFCTSCGEADCECIRKALFKLAEYEDLEEQGRLIKMPCAIGNRLYEPRVDRGIISEYRVNSISGSGDLFIGWELNSGVCSNLDGIFSDEIGKSVFLTKEEAEKALKKELPASPEAKQAEREARE